VSNFVVLSIIIPINQDAGFIGFIIFAPLGLIVLNFILIFLWLIAQFALKLISAFYNAIQNLSILNRIFMDLLTTLLKLILFVGIFVVGLYVTFSAWEAPFVTVQYFSCHLS